jgi:hypothetical protein
MHLWSHNLDKTTYTNRYAIPVCPAETPFTHTHTHAHTHTLSYTHTHAHTHTHTVCTHLIYLGCITVLCVL